MNEAVFHFEERVQAALRLFEKKVLKIIFDPRRHEVTNEWRKLQNEPHNLYS
jgi:hypothetical protein